MTVHSAAVYLRVGHPDRIFPDPGSGSGFFQDTDCSWQSGSDPDPGFQDPDWPWTIREIRGGSGFPGFIVLLVYDTARLT